jgi:hypothetical protein
MEAGGHILQLSGKLKFKQLAGLEDVSVPQGRFNDQLPWQCDRFGSSMLESRLDSSYRKR